LANVERLELESGRSLERILAMSAGRYGDLAKLIVTMELAETTSSLRVGQLEGGNMMEASDS
jgi:hypothetical protein